MEHCKILAASLCFGKDRGDKLETEKHMHDIGTKFGIELTKIAYYEAGPEGEDKIDACYVADLDDSVILAFRGTTLGEDKQAKEDWANNLLAIPTKVTGIPGLLHDGFAGSVTRLWDMGFHKEVQKRLATGKSLIITGYSKGAALAPIAAAFLECREIVEANRITLCFFEPPRPGDEDFKSYFNGTFTTAVRYEYKDDIVPHVPPAGKGWRLLEKIPYLGKIIEKKEGIKNWNYCSVGHLKFVKWDGNIVDGNSRWLIAERIAGLGILIIENKSSEMLKDHMPQEHLYPIVCDKEWPTGLKLGE